MIKLIPVDVQEELVGNLLQSDEFDIRSIHGEDLTYLVNAKAAIRFLASSLGLGREDEVMISSTSDSSFVSTCVSATLFNFSKISRVLTDKTKMIFCIHEFGFLNTKVTELKRIALERGIPLIEDSAHFIPSSPQPNGIGSFGDFLIHSIPKSLPIHTGGILIRKSNRYFVDLPLVQSDVEKQFNEQAKWLKWANGKRTANYKACAEIIGKEEVYQLDDSSCPFSYAFKSKNSQAIYQRFDEVEVEMVRTHIDGRVDIPLNPFHRVEDLLSFTRKLKEYV